MNLTDSNSAKIKMRPANKNDLAAINRVVESAVKTWKLPERVIRLAMPTYLYNEQDMQHLHILLAVDDAAVVTGVAAWEDAAERDCPHGQRGLLLHGLYVEPGQQHHGTGTRLLSAAAAAAREDGYDGLLVKAQADAEGFFKSRNMQRLAIEDEARDYPSRYWLDTRQQKLQVKI